jgi:hypothetical protein
MTISAYLSHPDKGVHGYEDTDVEMRGSFLARGPAIRVSHGNKAPGFANVNLYNLMAYLLKVRPAPNDGTINWA